MSQVQAQHLDDNTGKKMASLRLGWMLTAGEGYLDRPVVETAFGYRVVDGAGRGPGLFITTSGGVAIGEAFAESTLWSFRGALGIEPVFSARPGFNLVPFAQLGYLTSLKEDERHGLYGRAGIGIRLIRAGSFKYSFDPVSVTILPLADDSVDNASRYAIEVGVIRAVWQF